MDRSGQLRPDRDPFGSLLQDAVSRVHIPAPEGVDLRPEPYVDARSGGDFLAMSPKTLMRLARQGKVRAYSFSDGIRHHWRFLLSELDSWMKAHVNSKTHPVRSASPGRRIQ